MEELKMYCLNPNNWGNVWYTIAPDRKTALENIKKFMKKELDHIVEVYGEQKSFLKSHIDEFNKWNESTPDNLPNGYVLDEYENGDVIEGEFS